MSIKLAFCSLAFRNDPIDQVWQKTAEIGFDAIEIFWGHVEKLSAGKLENLAKSERAQKCPALVLAPYLCFTRGKELFEESIQRLKRVIEVSNILNCPKIRTFVDVGPTGVASAAASGDQWQAGFDGLRQACEMAPEKTFLLETHVNTLADCLDGVEHILQNVSNENLKLIVHPAGEMDFGGHDGFMRTQALTGGRVDHLHMNNNAADGSKTWVQSGSLDYKEYLSKIMAEGFDGSASVEYCFSGATWDVVKASEEFLREALAQ